ncbi:MAG TPA: glycosyltransferase family 39 protein [Vicinamibacteria bacterium]|nr:glycosyltransferase family 39 protein [Vicinamibacteria bacterium]
MTALATPIIFFAPGLLIVSIFARQPKGGLTLAEQMYVAFAGSLLVSGWVGLLLAELGHFSAVNVAAFDAVVVVLGAVAARKRIRLEAGRFQAGEFIVPGAILAFASVVYFPPFEHVLGGRDPGIYVNAGFHLAREGTLVYVDPVIESLPVEARPLVFPDKELPPWSYERFQGFRLEHPDTARVSPHGLHLYPVWIGMASSLFQMKSGLWVTPYFAILGVLGLFFALNRLFGLEPAAWAAGLLAVFQIQIWFARFPNSEVVVQFLFTFGLLCFFFMNEQRSSLAGGLAGFAFASTFLARFETVLFAIPIAVFLAWKRVRGELGKPELLFFFTFALVSTHAVVHDRLFAWPYVSSILGRHYWRFIGDNIVVLAAVGLLLFFAADRLVVKVPPRFLGSIESPAVRLGSALGLFALALYAYFVRPVWHAARTAPHDAEAFFRMGWYLYPAGLALATAGLMGLVVRARRAQAFFVLIALTFSFFFFYKVRVWHDHYFAMRRFIPVILPAFFSGIGVFLGTLRPVAGSLVKWGARAVAAALLLVYLAAGARLWRHNEFRGSLDFVEDLARHLGDEDIVFFPRQEGLHLLELPLAHLEGRNVLEFYTLKPDRALLERLLASWRSRYQDVYFVTNYKISLSGLFTRHVKDFWLATEKYEYAYTRPPRGPEPFHLRFTLSKAVDVEDLAKRVPPLERLDIGGSDDLQVAWFHEKELEEDGTTYRWSQRTSSIFLPQVGSETRTLALRMAGPKEDDAPLYPVEVAIDGQSIGSIQPTRSYATYELTIPPRDARSYAILTLTTQTWRPSRALAGASDVRDLGLRLDWIELQ